MSVLTIQRGCSYRIITRALDYEGKALVGLLSPGADDCDVCLDPDQLQSRLGANPDSIIVYNQHADAIAMVDALDAGVDRIFIEIAQDTKGVLGLHAHLRNEDQRQTLELIYQ